MHRRHALKAIAGFPLFAARGFAEMPPARDDYAEVVRKTAQMVGDREAQRLTAKHGLQVLNITWEDTGRFKNSAVGPNISDMTIQVQHAGRGGRPELTCMPVIRFPNFDDKTGDVALDKFYLPVGNERGGPLTRVSLRGYLGGVREFLTKPESWAGDRTYLLSDRDSHVLVSAQACFLPVPKNGTAEFNPVLFNYQSVKGDAAVLAVLVTRQGTSATVIDNVRDGFQANGVWGQRLFFNKNGQRASLTGQRKSDFQAGGGDTNPGAAAPEAAGEQGLNMVMLIQVPLKQRNPMRPTKVMESAAAAPAAGFGGGGYALRRSNVEDAVIGHGKVEGPFTEIDGQPIERDDRFPVRVTVQFYKATDNGVVSPEDVEQIAAQIRKVYDRADSVGSLVTQGETARPTEHAGEKVQPPGWWAEFWKRYEANTGKSRAEAVRELRKLRGPKYFPRTEVELLREAQRLPGVTAVELPPERAFGSFKR